MSEKRCAGINAEGKRCRSTALVDGECCTAHAEGGAERMRELARRGAAATNAKFARQFNADDLPPLRSLEDGERWAEAVARAVAAGQLTHAEGRTIGMLLREWREAYKGGRAVDELEARLDEKLRPLFEAAGRAESS